MISPQQKAYMLNGMVMWAEGTLYIGPEMRFANPHHEWFKPSSGDRLLFKRILEDHIRVYAGEQVDFDSGMERASAMLNAPELMEDFYWDYRDENGGII